MSEPLLVEADPTPNPEAYKFTVNRELNAGRGHTFDGAVDAAESPLAQRLFQVSGVRTLFFLNDFITVGRMPGAGWDGIIAGVQEAIRSFYEPEPLEDATASAAVGPS